MKVVDSILEVIGNTPMLRLNQFTKQGDAEILAKLEYLNPSGSIKDRIAKYMIEAAEKEGLINPGNTIVEASTGNTGTALAFVSAVKGYKMLIFGPKLTLSDERVRIMEAYGAQIEIIELDDEKDWTDLSVHGGVIEIVPRKKCLEMETKNQGVWWARQFSNEHNVNAHKETTAAEILDQTEGKLDAFVASVGTGGTLYGVAQVLKKHNPDIYIVGVEPASTPLLDVEKQDIPVIKGITDGLILDIIDSGLVDMVIPVDDATAIQTAHQLSEKEGLFCGISSGANVFASQLIAEKMGPGHRVVTVLPDNRDRYLFKEKYTT